MEGGKEKGKKERLIEGTKGNKAIRIAFELIDLIRQKNQPTDVRHAWKLGKLLSRYTFRPL